MLQAAETIGRFSDFFSDFFYRFEDERSASTLDYGRTLLSRCAALSLTTYENLHKGTPFYWLARAAFIVHDYQTAVFYIDAAVSEDLRLGIKTSPALLFFLVDVLDERQANIDLNKQLRKRFDDVIHQYNQLFTPPSPLTLSDIQENFLKPALWPTQSKPGEAWRALATALSSFLLEWPHRSQLLGLRCGAGSAEPFFIHLFKGCLLFESLLKANPKKTLTTQPPIDTLNRVLKELLSELGLSSSPDTSSLHFQDILNQIPFSSTSIPTVIGITCKIRNTTGHRLGWEVTLDTTKYDILAGYVAMACLHAIACLYRP